MAFIVETGIGLSNATSFVSVAYADAYFLDRLNTTWAGYTNDQKQSYLIQSTTYINNNYRFGGSMLLRTQALEFPRIFNDISTMPDKLLQATCEGAIRAAVSPLDKDVSAQVTERTVGSLTTKYANSSPSQPTYAIIDSLLQYYTIGGYTDRKVIRS